MLKCDATTVGHSGGSGEWLGRKKSFVVFSREEKKTKLKK